MCEDFHNYPVSIIIDPVLVRKFSIEDPVAFNYLYLRTGFDYDIVDSIDFDRIDKVWSLTNLEPLVISLSLIVLSWFL